MTPTEAKAVINKLADQVEALTKERDEYRLLGDAMVAGHKVERDELRMQIDSLCHEVAAIPAIKEERDALAAVAKMALDALESLFGVPAEFTGVGGGGVAVWRLGGSDKPRKAITALRQAGVK